MNNRVVYSDNGVLKDLSVALNEYKSDPFAFTYKTGEDFIYIGAKLPFNNIYFTCVEQNINDAEMTLEYWDGDNWIEVVELLDSTKGFKRSGHVEFVPDRDKGWQVEDTNYNGSEVDGLEDLKIYDRYWIRISFDADLNGSDPAEPTDPPADPPAPDVIVDMSLGWIGNIFSNDSDLKGEYPDLVKSKYLNAFETGKTNWEEQHAISAGLIIQDLIDFGVIKEKGQLLDWRQFTSASIHKVAEIVYNSFGDDYIDQSIAARKEYNARINKRHYVIDSNKDAIESPNEDSEDQGFFSR